MTTSTPLTPATLAATFDHTRLTFAYGESPEVLVPQLCAEARQYGFAGVCVRPEHVRLARQAMGISEAIKLASVVGFPAQKVTRAQEAEYPVIGAVGSTTKFQEICQAQSEGADELDVVLNVAYFKTDRETGGSFTQQELAGLRACAGDMPIKLILETGLLTDEEIRAVVALAVKAGIDCIKTSTGMVSDVPGATVETVRLIRQTLDELGAGQVWIKASGGISTLDQAQALLAAGAVRLGSSRTMEIMNELLALAE